MRRSNDLLIAMHDDQSKITYIDGGTSIEYGSNGGWDNDMSSKGTMEAVLAPEDASTSPWKGWS
jgi:hypothetical protein